MPERLADENGILSQHVTGLRAVVEEESIGIVAFATHTRDSKYRPLLFPGPRCGWPDRTDPTRRHLNRYVWGNTHTVQRGVETAIK